MLFQETSATLQTRSRSLPGALLFVSAGALLLALNKPVADPFQEIPLPKTFSNNLEISGLDISADTLYMLSEGCYKVYAFPLRALNPDQETEPSRTYRLPARSGDDLEALAVYHDLFFYTNERDNTVVAAKIGENAEVVPIRYNTELPQQRDNGEAGLEGLAIDVDRNLLYLLQERDRKENSRMAKLMVFEICRTRDTLQLMLKDELSIPVRNPYRYTSLGLTTDGRIFTIRSCYGGPKCNTGEYYVEYLALTSSGYFPADFESPDLHSFALEAAKMDYPNLEGIAVGDDGWVYMVSDNADTKDPTLCNSVSSRPTRLFRTPPVGK